MSSETKTNLERTPHQKKEENLEAFSNFLNNLEVEFAEGAIELEALLEKRGLINKIRNSPNPEKELEAAYAGGDLEKVGINESDYFKLLADFETSSGLKTKTKEGQNAVMEKVPETAIEPSPEATSSPSSSSQKESQREASKPEMTLDEIETKIKFAKDTGRVPGIGPEGLSYWEEQKRLLLERQKTEGLEKKIEKFQESVNSKYHELFQLQKKKKPIEASDYSIVENAELDIEIKNKKKEIFALEKDLEKLEKNPDGKEWKKQVKNVYEKAKENGKKVWGFLKERAKGVVTFGLWELKEAEVFRRGTKAAEKDIKTLGQRIQQEEGLSEAEALAEAKQMRETLGGTATAKQYETISNQITKEKKGRNEKVEKEIVDQAVARLEKRLEGTSAIANYRSVHGGEKVLTQENIEALRAELAVELKKLRNGQIRKDRINYASLMRKNLDPNWWARYIWGSLEMTAWYIGYSLLMSKAAVETATGGATKMATKGALEQTTTIRKGRWVWHIAKEVLEKTGITDPTNAQILKVEKALAVSNHIAVPEQHILGTFLDTQLQAGHPIKLATGIKAALIIKSALFNL